ncbi:PAS domain S-box protein [Paenibacillus sp. R14(2021)]|uniref:PAS domain S-box protein n=1 Tax=Paenibacillus sp. R14(2021) TaxID=2859228 RepID=UPI001C615296|nr:PAS domain S-box protein [Paenibacillus sp. R14(2021)]
MQINSIPFIFGKARTLNNKLRTLGFVIVLIVGAACTAMFSYIELNHQEKNIHRQLAQTLVLQQQFIDKWMSDRMSDIRLLANLPETKHGQQAKLEQIIALAKRNHSEFRSVNVIGKNGFNEIGISIQDRPYFRAAQQGKESVSDVLFSRVDGKRIIVFSTPIENEDHSFGGIVMGTVELTTIERFMQQFSYGEDGQTYLVSKDGQLITGAGSGTAQPAKVKPWLLERAAAGSISTDAYVNYAGVTVYGGYRWANNGNWLLIGEAARQDVLASLYTELKYAGLFTLLSVLAAILLMLRISKRISHALHQLLTGVRMIKDGGYHYRIDQRTLMSSTLEFQQLCRLFNSMADTIMEHTEALSKERNFAASIIDTAASLIVVLDKDGGILQFNRSCELVTGYTFDELQHASIYNFLIPEEEVQSVSGHFQDLLEAGGSYRNENHWRTRSGELRLIAWNNSIHLEASGGIKHIISIGIDITEQRQIEQSLIDNEERFRLLVGSMDEVVSTFDSDLKLMGVYGRAMDGFLNESQELYSGKTIHQLLNPVNARMHENAQRIALEGKNTVLDWSIQSPTGAAYYHQTSYSTLRNNGGVVKGVVSVSRDITQLKAAEEAYRESQERIANILESITDAFMALDNDWLFTYVNSEAEVILGRERPQIMGRALAEVYPSMLNSHMHACFRRAVKEQVPISTEEYMPHLNAWYEVHIYPSKDGLSVYLQNVTVRKELEYLAAMSQSRLSTIIETVPNGIVVVEENGMISMANRMAEEIFGMNKGDIENRPYDDAAWEIYDFDGKRMQAEDYPVTIAIRTRDRVSNSEFIVKRPNGTRVMISCNCSPTFDREGRMRSVLISLSDITSRIAIQNELKAANNELMKLSSLDGLTGVFNRRYFNEQLHEYWQLHAHKQQPLSLIMFDIDYFKSYNDSYGHLRGDTALKSVAAYARSSLVDPEGFVARYGGEEFGIVLPNTTLLEAAALGEAIRAGVENKCIPHSKSKVSSYLTVSFGVASVIPEPEVSEEALVSAADIMLYQAKRTRNTVAVHSGEGILELTELSGS